VFQITDHSDAIAFQALTPYVIILSGTRIESR